MTTFTSIMPLLPVADMDRAIAFYTGPLGFSVSTRKGDRFAIVARNGVELGLMGSRLSGVPAGHGRCSCKLAGGISGFYSDLCARGVRIQSELKDQANGMREFLISDPDENELSFSQPVPA